ncbi:hypothetical protein [Halorientalis regularis]|uniref:hypothetical protein n=1 Tax=Halorientalis regularis TaxID=660518 RepID=UPI001C31682E|nr:hypothetical protein [Halorientalis regularis]
MSPLTTKFTVSRLLLFIVKSTWPQSKIVGADAVFQQLAIQAFNAPLPDIGNKQLLAVLKLPTLGGGIGIQISISILSHLAI